MKVRAQCIEKANNDVFKGDVQRINEDSFINKGSVVAISDGAGGVGILADAWSQYLIENIPTKPFEGVEGLDFWISEIWEGFYNKYSKLLSNDPWQIKKFEDEGSLATLSSIWEMGNDKYIYQSYGDSTLFIYNKATGVLKEQDNVRSINYFGTSPALINWQTEKHLKDHFFQQEINLKKNEELILATDGIAMYIFGVYKTFENLINEEVFERKMMKIVSHYYEFRLTDFRSFMDTLKASLLSDIKFKKLTKEWYLNKCLPNDDYTIIWIENENKKVSKGVKWKNILNLKKRKKNAKRLVAKKYKSFIF